MEKWISVKEELPINMSHVLVWFAGLYNEYKIAWYHLGHFYQNILIDEDITKWVTHWMALPPPPEKK